MLLLYRGTPYESDHQSTQTPETLPQPKVHLSDRGTRNDSQPHPQLVD
jgi:hypothetical protein